MSQVTSVEQADAGGSVVRDPRYCIQCGYLLVGLPTSGACPECGMAVELSLREPWLASSNPTYLASLRKGFSLVLNAILLMVIATIVSLLGAVIAGALGMGPRGTVWIQFLSLALSVVVSVMLYLGYWQATTPDPSQVAQEATSSARQVVRTTTLALAALSVIQLVLQGITLTGGTAGSTLLVYALLGMSLAGFVVWAVQYFAMMRYLRWLAGRVADRYIVNRTKRYMWLLPLLSTVGVILFFLGPLLALVMYWNLLQRFHKHVKSIIDQGKPAELPGM